jgi:5-methylthioribose kinase
VNDAFIDLASDRRELVRMLEQLRLCAPGEPVTAEVLTGGVSSNILRVDLASGPVCVKQALPKLKVQKDWQVSTDRVLAEIEWLKVAQTIVPGHVPRILGEDTRRSAFVMEFLSNQANWKTELLEGRIDVEVGAQVANVLGRLHVATAHDPAIARRFANDATFFSIRLEPYLLDAARAHPVLAHVLHEMVETTRSTRVALVHGDVSPKNVLLGRDGPVLLDAECACYGDPAFDLAFLLNHALLKAAHRPMFASQFHALFERIASTYLPQVAWESATEFDRRCAVLLPGLLLARIDGKSPVEYLSEGSRDAVRAAAIALLSAPSSRLQDVLDRFRSSLAGNDRVRPDPM